jgi:deazaflavin-dependent oxidoreductase (nitroreductase family)
MRRVVWLAGAALVALTLVFFPGMRFNWPPVLDTVRRTSRATKPLVLKRAGTPGGPASVVRHVGRTSGRDYETPVSAVPTGDGFVVALPYGKNTDWLQNVLASGSATVVHEGVTYQVERPEVVPLADTLTRFPARDQRSLRLFAVTHCLVVRTVEPA